MTTTKWDFDPAHSSVNFTVRHMMVSKVRGSFTRWHGSLEFDPDKPESARVDVTIDADSIETRDAKRDAHLRSSDFLHAEQHPEIHFVSKRVARKSEDRFVLEGEIEIRGTKQPINLEVEYAGQAKDPWGGQRVGFSAHGSLNRKDFGLQWNQALETGGVLVGDKVELNLEIEAVQAKAAEAAE